MTLKELNQRYYFHDSILDRIEYHNAELKMHCTFCEFLQNDYDESDYTNSNIIVVFHNASYSIADGFSIENSSFLEQKLQGDIISFFMENMPNKYGHLIVKAESVDVIKVRSYNL